MRSLLADKKDISIPEKKADINKNRNKYITSIVMLHKMEDLIYLFIISDDFNSN